MMENMVSAQAKEGKKIISMGAPRGSNAALVLSDGTVFWGLGIGAQKEVVGEVCFNTSMTGYQEILSDPSYKHQLIVFTFPHIGNVGINLEDIESHVHGPSGLILGASISDFSNFRATQHLNEWLIARDLVGIAEIDTRALTRRIRDHGMVNGTLVYNITSDFDVDYLRKKAQDWHGIKDRDLTREVTTPNVYSWSQGVWSLKHGYRSTPQTDKHVVVLDFGVKLNILRHLASEGLRLTVLPADTSAEKILSYDPDGIFLSSGPGDPFATAEFAVPTIRKLLEHKNLPIFGICLGHQLLALALGAKTEKMHFGHHGVNQPVQNLENKSVEITAQNHCYVVCEPLPDHIEPTHRSLFDGVLEGIKLKGRPVFSVQYHPESSAGPQDSYYLFHRFREYINANVKEI